jgi:hypothetical protein
VATGWPSSGDDRIAGSIKLGGMTDSALWIAALTGGTAVLVSWVTSRGNAHAARVQAEASGQALQYGQLRETRRTAYLEFIEQAHTIGELYWRLGDVYVQLTDPDDQLAGVQELRNDLRDAYDPLMRCARILLLEGPVQVSEAAEAVTQAAAEANSALHIVSQGEEHSRERFDEACRIFRLRLVSFIEAARATMQSAS